VSATPTGCTVDVGGGRVPAQFGSSYLPEVNEQVWIFFIDENPFLMGPAAAKAGSGTVVSVAGNLVTLNTSYGQVVVPFNSAVTPSAGQIMKLVWQEGGYAESVMSTSPQPPVAPAPPSPAGPTQHADNFVAQDAGSHNANGWWTNQVRADDSDLSAFWYGSKISDTIPSNAVITSIKIYISPVQIYGSAPNFGLHSDLSKPAGAPALGSIMAIPISAGWVTLPNSFATSLQAGGGAYGVGFAHGGFNILNSLAADGQSGKLLINSNY
jgi:hypothetical protein